jgi:hypothetical protein
MDRMKGARRARSIAAFTFVIATLAGARPAPPPAITVVPRQGIDWGALIPGTTSRVDPRDAGRRGEIDFVGKGNATVFIVLPRALVSAEGQRVPLSFHTGDLIIEYTRNGPTSMPDPGVPIDIHPNPGQGDVRLFIGGIAAPPIAQHTGSYDATITALIAVVTV